MYGTQHIIRIPVVLHTWSTKRKGVSFCGLILDNRIKIADDVAIDGFHIECKSCARLKGVL